MEFDDDVRRVSNEEESDQSHSSDSGISTARNGPVKKLQFSVEPEVHIIDYPRRFGTLRRMKTYDNLALSVEYNQGDEPQVPMLVNDVIDQQPCDEISDDDYKVPITPPRKPILKNKITSRIVENPAATYPPVFPKALKNSRASSDKSVKGNSLHLSSIKFDPKITSLDDDLLKAKTKECLNLIYNTTFKNKKEIFPDHTCNNQVTKNELVAKLEKKFVVNGYESRLSNKLDQPEEKAPLPSSKIFVKAKPAIAKLASIQNDFDEKCYNLESNAQDLKKQYEYMELKSLEVDLEMQEFSAKQNLDEKKIIVPQGMSEDNAKRYQLLRKARDMECIKMSQASKALYEMKIINRRKDWLEELIIEKILLETSERIKLLELKLQDTMYALVPQSPVIEGTIELSGIKFPFGTQIDYSSDEDYTEFFVLVVSHADQIYTSEYITGEQNPLRFEKKFVLQNVSPNFQIKLKLFCLKQRTSDECFWEKLNNSKCCELMPKLRIIYQNRLTSQYEDENVVGTSFKLCAEAILTCNQINKPTSNLLLVKDVFNKLDGTVRHSFKCEQVQIKRQLSQFLDVGTLVRGGYVWERKWCMLAGVHVLICNFPCEQEYGGTVERLNLQHAFGPIITNPRCPRKRTFQLNIFRGSVTSPGEKSPILILRTLYFSCRSADDFEKWTKKLEEILNGLRYFQKLEYEERFGN